VNKTIFGFRVDPKVQYSARPKSTVFGVVMEMENGQITVCCQDSDESICICNGRKQPATACFYCFIPILHEPALVNSAEGAEPRVQVSFRV
jgi:hypothetical protein